MKSFSIILSCIFYSFCVPLYSQNIELGYTMISYTEEGSRFVFNYDLIVNNSSSIYLYKDMELSADLEELRSIINKRASKFKGIYYNKVDDDMYYNADILGKYLNVREQNFVNEQVEWYNPSDGSSKEVKLLGMSCKQANLKFRGREYIAYYTDSLNITAAPYKFKGLPGVVLKITSTDGNYRFEATSIKLSSEREIINPYENDKISFNSFREYKEKRILELERYQKKVRSEDPESELEIKDNSIELTWE